MDNSFKEGERLIIELNNSELYEGDIIYGTKNKIEIINVIHKSVELPGNSIFYRSDIKNIFIKSKKVDEASKKCAEVQRSINNNAEKNSTVIKLSSDEYDHYKYVAENYVFLEMVDSRFYEAIEKLKSADNIGIVGLGMENIRGATIKLLVMCTWNQVYIIDFVSITDKYFIKEIKGVLEYPYTKKIVHGGGQLVDCLFRTYNISIFNVFDTEIADMILMKHEKMPLQNRRNLDECLQFYLNFPPSLVKKAQATSQEKWSKRPLKDSRKIGASQLGIYTLVLKDQLEMNLLKDVYRAMDNIYNMYSKANVYTYSDLITSSTINESMENLLPSLANVDLTN